MQFSGLRWRRKSRPPQGRKRRAASEGRSDEIRKLRLIVQHQPFLGAGVGQLNGVVTGHAQPIGNSLDRNPPVRAVAGLGGERAPKAARAIGRQVAKFLEQSAAIACQHRALARRASQAMIGLEALVPTLLHSCERARQRVSAVLVGVRGRQGVALERVPHGGAIIMGERENTIRESGLRTEDLRNLKVSTP